MRALTEAFSLDGGGVALCLDLPSACPPSQSFPPNRSLPTAQQEGRVKNWSPTRVADKLHDLDLLPAPQGGRGKGRGV